MRPPDDTLVWNLIREYEPWLERLCRGFALRLRDRGDVDQFTLDIAQGATVRAIQIAPRYLSEAPRTTFEQQVKNWLSLCAMQEYSAVRRGLDATPLRDDPDDGTEDDGRTDRAPDPEQLLQAEEARALVRSLADSDHGKSPWCHLAAIAIFVPELVKRQHFERAHAYRKGGAKGIRRPLDDAWRIFLDGRARPDLVNDPTEWKRFVTELLLFEEPFGSADRDGVIAKVKSFEVQVKRGVDNLGARARDLDLGDPDDGAVNEEDEADR